MATGHSGVTEKITEVRTTALLDKDTASGLANTNSVDMLGFETVAFDIVLGKIVNGAVVDAWVIESAESNLANGANVSPAVAAAQFLTTSNDVVVTLKVHGSRLTKRYVGVTLKTATQNVTNVAVIARQYVDTGVVPPTEAAAAYQYVVQA